MNKNRRIRLIAALTERTFSRGQSTVSIGPRLRHAREIQGLTIAELSTRSGYSVRAIQEWEDGKGVLPSYHAVETLADALGMDPRVLAADPQFPEGYIDACLDPWRDVSPEDIDAIIDLMAHLEHELNHK